MELLAPAGDWDALKAALAAGADAVYLGGKSFSARSQAANFDLPQLKEAAELLHLHRRKIYVTVNTLLADSELPDALEFLTELYNLGIRRDCSGPRADPPGSKIFAKFGAARQHPNDRS
jgi:putative protease